MLNSSGVKTPLLAAGLLFFSAGSAARAAEGLDHHWSATGSWLGNPSVLGGAGSWAGEAAVERMFQPRAYTAFFAGPRFGLLGGQRSGFVFLDAVLGGEAQLWLVNVAGPGLAADWVLPLTVEESVAPEALLRYRLEAFFGLRVRRLGELGALGVRAGAYYDRLWGMGLKVGLSFALGGLALP